MGTTYCKNCGQSIEYWSDYGWLHTNGLRRACIPVTVTYAEPEEK